MTAPQTPPPCPPWCASKHALVLTGYALHCGPELITGAISASVRIEQEWDLDRGTADAVVSLAAIGYSARPIDLTPKQAKALADLMAGPIAEALRQAADELDRIGGAS